jgi:hypothetical protein
MMMTSSLRLPNEGQTTIKIRAATAALRNRTERETAKIFIAVYSL